ncbi:MAG: hypothetical protein D6694_13675 [Gammaproteobacteria bacterium]|nr:MAG: hypothetical protein D6694_13675 [Gammaproteobacteria bacterium]
MSVLDVGSGISLARVAAGGAIGDGATPVHIHGYNPAVALGSHETIWPTGGLQPNILSAATSVEVVSSSADDASAGIGARTVRVHFLDANYAEGTEDVTMNGITAVAMTNQVIAVNKIEVLTVGSSGVAKGLIDVRTVSGGTVMRRFYNGTIGYGDQNGFYSVPANHKLLIFNELWEMETLEANQLVHYYLKITGPRQSTNSNPWVSTFYSHGLNQGNNWGPVSFKHDVPIVINEKQAVEATAIVSAGTVGDRAVRCLLEGVLVDTTKNILGV